MSTSSTPGADWRRSGQPTATMPPVPPGGAQQAPGPGRPPQPAQAARPAPRRGARKARLVLARVDPWSVMKLSFLLSVALAVVSLVATFILWSVLDSMGVFDALGRTVESVTRASDTEQGVDILDYVGLQRVMLVTALLTAVNVVLLTALSTLAAFLYNLAASLVGGLHVTFTEDV